MGRFNRGDNFGGRKRFDNDRGSRGGGRPSMHQAVCDECGKDCEVPFKPTGDKPVFCSYCFDKKETSNSSRAERRIAARQNRGDRQMFRAVCDKCGKDCEVPFKPSSDKPIFCSECFGKGEKGANRNKNVASSDQYSKQFEILNNKIDNILEMLSSETEVKKEKPIAKAIKKTVEKKTVAKKAAAPKKAAKKVAAKKKEVKKKVAPKKVVKKAVAKKKVVKKTATKKKK